MSGLPIVGEDEQSLRQPIEPADVKELVQSFRQDAIHRRPPADVSPRRQVPGRLVERDPTCRPQIDPHAVDPDHVPPRRDPGALLGDDHAIHADSTVSDQPLTLTP